MFHYFAFGMRITSDLELPELFEGHGTPDIAIKIAGLQAAHPNGVYASWVDGAGSVFHYWEGVGIFRIRQGAEIIVDPSPDATPERIRLFLLGACMGTLLQQRGQFVLHASAVALPEGAVAFLGGKGFGKSTTAAFLMARGHPLVTDDVLAVDLQTSPVRAYSGLLQLRMWPDTINALGHDAANYDRLHPQFDKRDFPTAPLAPQEWPLHAIYVLGLADQPQINLLNLRESFMHLLANWYGFRFDRNIHMALGQPEVLRQCATFLQHTPVYLLQRPGDLQHQPAVAELIEKHVAGEDVGGSPLSD